MYLVTTTNASFKCLQYVANGGWTLHLDKATKFATFDEAVEVMHQHENACVTNA